MNLRGPRLSSNFPPVIILAGGVATRLGDIAKQIPKAMMPVAGAPFIDHQLKLLAEQQVKTVILSLSHLGEQIEKFVGTGSSYGLTVNYTYDGPQRLGTGGAVRSALHLVPECFAVLYGDTYLDIKFKPIFETYLKSGKDGLMTVLENKNSWDRSNIWFVDGAIKVYDKYNQNDKMHHIDYGLSILNKSCFGDFKTGQAFDLAEVFERRISENRIAGYEVYKRFYEIGTPASLKETEQYLAGRKAP